MALPGHRWPQKLFDRSGRRLLRYLAARLRDGTDADDLAQEAYLRLLRVDESLVVRDPRSYALRVATNVANEWGRLSRHRREHVGTDFIDEQESERLGPMEQAANAQQVAAVKRALAGMSPTRRAVVLMHIRDGLTYPQIAAQVGLSVSMVGKHLSLGLEACRELLK
jgi:RNA polymerase sigma factor (sigma-70 family)